MIKELALALEFAKAPKELQEYAAVHLAALKRLEKAESQVELWEAEVNQALKVVNESTQTFNKLMKAWSPDALKDGTIEVKK